MNLFRAFRSSARALLRARTFTTVVILVLAFGIAVCTTVFTLVDELLLNPFPYRDPAHLVIVWESNPALGQLTASRMYTAWENFEAWKTQNHTFQDMEAFQIFLGFDVTGLKNPEHVIAARATPGLFQMLGVNADSGRTFLPGDDTPGTNATVILTRAFADKHFGSNNPVGHILSLDGTPYTVIGILPDQFHLPALFGGIAEYKPDVWLPLPRMSNTDSPQTAKRRQFVVCARLKPGISVAQAKTDMATVAAIRATEDPALNRGYGVNVFTLDAENTDPDLRNELRALFAAAILVLLLACSSLAGLMLVRTTTRRKNLAIMAAMGASRFAIIKPIIIESLFLAVVAGSLAFLMSFGLIHAVVALRPSDIHAPERLSINLETLIFAGCTSLLTVLIFGLIPAWLTVRGNLSEALKANPTGEPLVQHRALTRSILLSVQIAVALTLAIAATLLIRSFQRLLEVDPGFRSQQVLTAHLALSRQRYSKPEDRSRFCEQLREQLDSIPGVQSVAFVDNMPLYAVHYTTFQIEGRPTPEPTSAPSADDAHVTPTFFRALNVRLVRGRYFTDQDAATNPPNAVIVNETLARELWPNQDPLGSHLRPLAANATSVPWQTVVGVAADFRQFNTDTPARPELLWPAKVFSEMTVILRTTSPSPLNLAAPLQQAVWGVDHDQPITDIQTLEQIVAHDNSQRRFNMLTLTAFAAFSVFLTLLGVYGLISSLIASQIRAIGIRLALGAGRLQVCFALLRPAAPPILLGIALGLLSSFLSRRLITSILFQVSPLDPKTYIVIPIALILILILTSFLATIRAARLDPSKVLREE